MAESYSVKAILSVDDKGFSKSMANAANSMNGLESTATKSSNSIVSMGTAFAVAEKAISAVATVIGSSLADAVSRVDTLNQFPKIMEQMGFSSDQAEASVQKLSDGIVGLPTSLDTIVDSAQNIALITGNLDQATDVALALNNALIASGASTDEAARATEQYDKMLSTGKVNSMQWTTLEQDMKYALVEVAKQLGITSGNTQELYQKMQDGEITFDQFNEALIECSEAEGGFADMALTASAGIETSWENVQTAVVRGVANVIQAYNEAASDNSLPTIQEALDSLRGVADTAFNALSSAVTGLVGNFDVLLAAVTPVAAGIAGLKVAESVSKSVDKLKDSGKNAAQSLKDLADKSLSVKDAQEKQKTASEQLEAAQKKVNDANDKLVQADSKLEQAAKKSEEAIKKKNEATKLEKQYGEDSQQAVQAHAEAEELAQQAEELSAEAKTMNAEATADLSKAEQESATASQAYADAQQEEATAQQATTTSAIAKNAALSVLSGQMNIVEAAQTAWNAAMAANPIGTVVTAVSTLVGVLGALGTALDKAGVFENTAWKQTKKLSEATDEVCDSVNDAVDAFHDDSKAAQDNTKAIKEQVSQIIELSNKQEKSADDVAQLQTLTESLNESVEGLNVAYDEQTGAINMTEEALVSLTTAYSKLEEYQAAQEHYAELTTAQTEAQEQLTVATDAYNSALDEMQTATANGTDLGLGYSIMLAGLEQDVANASDAEKDAANAVSEAQQQMTEARQAAKEAADVAYAEESARLQQMVADDTISYEDLSEANQAAADSMRDTWNDYADAAQNIFDTIDTTTDLSVQNMIDNINQNQTAMEGWGDNTQTLRDRFASMGLDTALLDQLVDLGPDGAAYIAELVTASDDQLRELETSFENGAQVATDAMFKVYGEAAGEIPSQVQDYITTPTEESVTSQLEGIEWGDVSQSMIDSLYGEIEASVGEMDLESLGEETGTQLPTGLAVGMLDFGDVEPNGQQLGKAAVDSVAQGAGVESPSVYTQETGQYIVEGLALGLSEEGAATEAAQALGQSVIDAVNAEVETMDFTAAGQTAMASLASAITAGMGTVQSAVKSGMAQVKSSVTSGMQAVSSAMSSGFSSAASTATSGMSKVTSAVTSGMNSAKSSVTSGMNSIKSTFTSSWNNIATTVTTKMNSIKTTITSGMSSAYSTVSSKMSSIYSTINSKMNSAYSSVKSAMSKIASAISSYGSKAVSNAKSVASRIASAFSGLYSKCYSYGASAMNGLTAGIKSRGSAAVSAARSIANQVASAMSSALKVGSPSKVTRKIGEWTGIGLANGLESTTGIVTYAAQELADAAVPEITTFASLTQPRSYSSEGQLTANGLEAVDLLSVLLDIERTLQSDDFMPDITVETELDIDGKEFAKTIAPDMQDAEDKLQARQSRRDKFAIG